MNSIFPDVKPMPAPNPRVALGNNEPPLEDRIVLDFDEALRRHDGLIERIDQMERDASEAVACETEDDVGRAADFVRITAATVKIIEAERETLNRPLLTAQRALKGRADSFTARATAAGAKVRGHINTYLAEQERIRLAEEKRIADERRAEEAKAEAERQRLQAIENERAAAEQRAAKPVEVAPLAPQFVMPPVDRQPIRGNYGATVAAVENWDVKVVNVRQVPDQYLKHASVIEAIEKVIRPHVRGKNGMRSLKGCEIFSTKNARVG